MKVYTRVNGNLAGVIFAEGKEGISRALVNGKWVQGLSWTNKELRDNRFFRLVGNNFRLR